MAESSYDPVYLEILRMAKDLVMQEYTDIRAQDHNRWLVESEHLWRTQRLRIAYPTIPIPPTEYDIIVRAQVLLNFLASKENTKHDIIDQSLTIDGTVEPEEVKDKEPVVDIIKEEPLKIEEMSQQEVIQPSVETEQQVIQPSVEVVEQEEQTKLSGRILPSVLKRLEEIKNNWGK